MIRTMLLLGAALASVQLGGSSSEPRIGGGRLNPPRIGVDVPARTVPEVLPSFSMDFPASYGASSLPTAIDGCSTVFRYVGDDATTTTWSGDVGETLDAACFAGDFTLGLETPLADGTEAAQAPGTAKRCYQPDASGTYDLDFSSTDIVIEVVFKVGAFGGVLFAKNDSGGGPGWVIRQIGGPVIRAQLEDSGGVVVPGTATIATGAWYHGILASDQDGSARWYVNGNASGSAQSVAALGSTSNADLFTIGQFSGGNGGGVNEIALLAAYTCGASGLPSMATLARQRHAQLTGVYPQSSDGTATPATIDRSTAATLTRGGLYYTVGEDWPRVEGGRYLAEATSENLIIQSNNFGSGWTQTRVSTSGSASGPGGAAWLTGLQGTIDDDTHCVSQAITGITSARRTFLSVHARPGTRDWVAICRSGPTCAYFNASTCTAGSGAFQADLIGSTCRGSMVWYAVSTTDTIEICAAESDGDRSFSDAGIMVYAGGAQLDNTSVNTYATVSSYMATTSTSAQRADEDLSWVANDGNLGSVPNQNGTAEVGYESIGATAYFAGNLFAVDYSTTDQVYAYNVTTGQASGMTVIAGGVSQGSLTGTTRISGVSQVAMRWTWSLAEGALYVDGILDNTAGPYAAIASTYTRARLCGNRLGQFCASGHFDYLTLYPAVVAP